MNRAKRDNFTTHTLNPGPGQYDNQSLAIKKTSPKFSVAQSQKMSDTE